MIYESEYARIQAEARCEWEEKLAMNEEASQSEDRIDIGPLEEVPVDKDEII